MSVWKPWDFLLAMATVVRNDRGQCLVALAEQGGLTNAW
jgi:hypothetical protein